MFNINSVQASSLASVRAFEYGSCLATLKASGEAYKKVSFMVNGLASLKAS
jgi:hypothetical protein